MTAKLDEVVQGMTNKNEGGLGRKEFLNTMGLGTVSLFTPGISPRPGLLTQLIAQPVKIYDNYLRGVQFYGLPECLGDIKVGDHVELKRFPDHKHDRFAVGVEWDRYFLGYLPAFENIVLANLLDAGARLTAMVTAKHSLYEVGIGVWTDLIVSGHGANTGLSDQAADEVDDRYRG